MVLVLMMPLGATAAEIYGGLSWNSVEMDEVNELIDVGNSNMGEAIDSVDSVWGYYGGVLFSADGLKYGLEVEQLSFSRSWERHDASISGSTLGYGPVVGLTLVTTEKLTLTAVGSILFHNSELEIRQRLVPDEEEQVIAKEASGVGYKLALACEYRITDSFSLFGRIGHRVLNQEVGIQMLNVNEFDWTGLESAAGFSVGF